MLPLYVVRGMLWCDGNGNGIVQCMCVCVRVLLSKGWLRVFCSLSGHLYCESKTIQNTFTIYVHTPDSFRKGFRLLDFAFYCTQFELLKSYSVRLITDRSFFNEKLQKNIIITFGVSWFRFSSNILSAAQKCMLTFFSFSREKERDFLPNLFFSHRNRVSLNQSR